MGKITQFRKVVKKKKIEVRVWMLEWKIRRVGVRKPEVNALRSKNQELELEGKSARPSQTQEHRKKRT